MPGQLQGAGCMVQGAGCMVQGAGCTGWVNLGHWFRHTSTLDDINCKLLVEGIEQTSEETADSICWHQISADVVVAIVGMMWQR